MFQELKFQLSTAILTLVTVAAGVSAVINFQQQSRFRLPDDGVIWVDRSSGVEALDVSKDGPAAKCGLKTGDILVNINGSPIGRSIDVTKILVRIGAWSKADYLVERGGVEVKAKLIIGEVPRDLAVYYFYFVGLAYLAIGLFVYFRRGTAYKAQHFYIFCLVSFIFFSFHYTGKLNNFDKLIYWGNIVAGALAPVIFVHFCFSFPEPRKGLRARVTAMALYVLAAGMIALYVVASSGMLRVSIPLVELRWMLDRMWLAMLTTIYIVGGVALSIERGKFEDPIVRRQLQWLRNGTLCGILPFAFFYTLPYVIGFIPTPLMKASVLSLQLIPLSLAYAIVRYRLMDVDILFRRGYAYTLATLCVLAAFYGIIFSLASLVQKNFQDLGNTGLITVMLAAAFLFQPIRNWIQERLDRYFYREQYDYRRTLVEFARELSAETDLETMLHAVAERLLQTLSISHLAFFLTDDDPDEAQPRFRLRMGVGLRDRNTRPITAEDPLDLSFLHWKHDQPYLFFERTRYRLDAISGSWAASVRRTIEDLDLTYYLPCVAQGRTVGYLGVSRTRDGDFLSSVDLELLLTLTGYVAIAIENTRLYSSLARKVDEYERLKEFSENIVESINVGILAADLDDRVESWNTQIEHLTGIPRDYALGRPLSALFPADLAEQFERIRTDTGIYHIYKYVLRPAATRAAANGSGNGNGGGPAPLREATLNIAIAPLVSKHQEHIGRLVIFDDVTDRAELEKQLVQADKLSSIGLLAAGVAHEVNTPLAVISNYAQMLAKQVANDDQKARMLDKIAKSTFRASEIVNGLLNFSRTSTTDFGQVELNRVVLETLSLVDHQLKKAGVEVRTALDASMAPIHGNAGKLQQVFLNLFLNARDAMEGGGLLEIRTSSEESGARVEVSDTGHGIAPEHLHRIYDPFFTTKAARKGTGLGLSVSYGIIQEHGGTIEVFNRPGGGTRFQVELPWSKAANRAGGEQRKPVNV
ncbi:MAG: GAF domain-containing protein [Acidobacteriia bacterium]|nr:GAF domain-containing protein [Terriglobia bacterium]